MKAQKLKLVTPTPSARLLIAGGGTGGHVLAGVAVAEAWRRKFEKNAPVLFVGAAGGIEEKLVPRAGFQLSVLNLGSLNRVSFSRRFKTCFQLPWAFVKSAVILMKYRPSVVLGVGGYSSGPLILMAKVLKTLRVLAVRIAILEQNAIPGMTNRILGRFVDLILAAFPGTEAHFPGRSAIVTGNPVRSSMKAMPPANRKPFTLFVFGGSQGAKAINSLVLEALPHLQGHAKDLRWVHQTGEKDHERVLEGYKKQGVPARVEKFIHEMPKVYEEASLLICRSGSSTLSEIAAVGRASILIPLPTAADNHQEKNARVFVDHGAAVLLLQQESQGKDLAKLIISLMEDSARISSIERAVQPLHRPKASEDIVDLLSLKQK